MFNLTGFCSASDEHFKEDYALSSSWSSRANWQLLDPMSLHETTVWESTHGKPQLYTTLPITAPFFRALNESVMYTRQTTGSDPEAQIGLGIKTFSRSIGSMKWSSYIPLFILNVNHTTGLGGTTTFFCTVPLAIISLLSLKLVVIEILSLFKTYVPVCMSKQTLRWLKNSCPNSRSSPIEATYTLSSNMWLPNFTVLA